jgi:hypothetical protein
MIHTKMRPLLLILFSFLALLLVAPTHLSFFTWSDHGLVEASSSPSGFTILSPSPTDLDQDGQPEIVILQGGKVEIRRDDRLLWSSPSSWDITQVEIADLNHDGKSEVALLLWREFAPWPIDAYIPHPGRIQDFHDRENRSCHLILIGWSQGAFRELWAGSALADPLSAFTAIDINQDGYQELAALESQYNAPLFATQSITIWEWNGFGFTLLSRGPKGYVHSLNRLRTTTAQELLLIQGIIRR